jgi:hypothetical protein
MNTNKDVNIENENKLLNYLRDNLRGIEGLKLYNIAELNDYRYDNTGFNCLDAVAVRNNNILFYIELKERVNLLKYIHNGLYIQANKLDKLKRSFTNTFVIYFEKDNYDINYHFLVSDILDKEYDYTEANYLGSATYSVTDIEINTINRIYEYVKDL